MKARDKVLFILSSLISALCAEASEFGDGDMTGCTCKHELQSGFISAGLGDTAIISAPIVKFCARPVTYAYYLNNPKGDSTKLNINTTKITRDYCTRTAQYPNSNMTTGKLVPVIYGSNEIRNFEKHNILTDIYDYMTANEFTIGPLSEEDHGNWVLSTYYKTYDGDCTEMFRVISVEIVEPLPVFAKNTQLAPGQIFKPRFLNPINYLETCEILKPTFTGHFEDAKFHREYDRFYDRDKSYLDFCGFRIPNVTKTDEGVWTIIAVGKIVYRGEVYLEVRDTDEDF